MANSHSLDLELASSQYSEIVDASQTGLDITGDWTIEAWIKVESLPSGGNQAGIAYKSNSGDGNRSYGISLFDDSGTNKLLTFISADGTLQDQIRFTWTPSLATWYHVAVTCDVSAAASAQFEFFLGDESTNPTSQGNGSVILDNGAASVFSGSADFNIGAINNTASNFFDGLLNSVRVWSDIRTSTELVDNYKTSTPAGGNLVGSWYYNNDHNDDSGNGNTLTAVNSPVFSTDIPYTEGGVAVFFGYKNLTGVGV